MRYGGFVKTRNYSVPEDPRKKRRVFGVRTGGRYGTGESGILRYAAVFSGDRAVSNPLRAPRIPVP